MAGYRCYPTHNIARFLTVHTRFFLSIFFLNHPAVSYFMARHFRVNSFPLEICAPSHRAYAALPLPTFHPSILPFNPPRWRSLGVRLFGKRLADVVRPPSSASVWVFLLQRTSAEPFVRINLVCVLPVLTGVH